MPSDRRIAANRRNARRSTGPKTAEGRRRASGNARRHGLTTALSPDRVQHHLGVILEGLPADGRLLSGEGLGLAHALADAEAQLERVKEADARLLEALLEAPRREEPLEPVPEQGADGARAGDDVDPDDEVSPRTCGGGDARRGRRARTCQSNDEEALRCLLRYRKEAENRRHRALRDWIAYLARK